MKNRLKADQSKTTFITALTSVFLLFGLQTSASLASTLPDLGSPDLVVYDNATEEKLGRAFTNALHTEYDLYQDLESIHYIRQLGHKLASYTGTNRNFSFYVIKDPSINAFAGPDGVIGIHTGLINAVHTEDELAAVIAHEIAHVTQNHLSRRYDYSSNQGSVNSIASLIAAILIGMHNPDAGMATLMGGMGYNLQQQLKNSRIHEGEADAIGIGLLHKAGYDPHAMGNFFGRLAKASQHDTFHVPEILRTHPVTERRLAEAENRAAQLDSNIKPPISKDTFALIKLRVARGTDPNFTTTLHQIGQLNDSQTCYQRVLTSSKVSDQTNCLMTLLTDERTPNYLTTYLESINNQQRKAIAPIENKLEQTINYMLELHPDNQALLVHASRYYFQIQQKEKGIELLENNHAQLSYRYHVLKELSEKYAEKNQQAHAYFYFAVAQYEIGNTIRSQHLLKRATEALTSNDSKLKQKIQTFKAKHSKSLKEKDKNKN